MNYCVVTIFLKQGEVTLDWITVTNYVISHNVQMKHWTGYSETNDLISSNIQV